MRFTLAVLVLLLVAAAVVHLGSASEWQPLWFTLTVLVLLLVVAAVLILLVHVDIEF